MEAIIIVAVPVVGVCMLPVGASVIVRRASRPLLPERLCRSCIALSPHVPNPHTTHASSQNGACTAVEHPEERLGSGRRHVRPSSSPLACRPAGSRSLCCSCLPVRSGCSCLGWLLL